MPSDIKTKAEIDGTEIDMTLIKALSHPNRYLSLHILNKRVASPNEIANEIGVSVNTLSYHIRELDKLGCIEMVKTEQRRGATEHFYRATKRAMFTDEEWVHIPANFKDDLVIAHMRAVGKEVGAGLASGTFNARSDRRQSWLPMQVDEQGWAEAQAVLADAEEKMYEIQAASATRLVEEGGEAVSMAVSLMGFETAPVDD